MFPTVINFRHSLRFARERQEVYMSGAPLAYFAGGSVTLKKSFVTLASAGLQRTRTKLVRERRLRKRSVRWRVL